MCPTKSVVASVRIFRAAPCVVEPHPAPYAMPPIDGERVARMAEIWTRRLPLLNAPPRLILARDNADGEGARPRKITRRE